MAAGSLVVTTSTQHERALVTASTRDLAGLEERAGASPADVAATRELAQAYLDERQPGLATVLLESRGAALRTDARLAHLYARALLEEGRDRDALGVERRVIAACAEPAHSVRGCDAPLLASATRRVAIVEELVRLGVEDARAQPDISLVAYKNATREARVAPE